MDWSFRVCFARNLAVARGAQTGRPGGVGTARSGASTATLLPIESEKPATSVGRLS
jgi:hypothetical protein